MQLQGPWYKTDVDMVEWAPWSTTKVLGDGAPVVLWRCVEVRFNVGYPIIILLSLFVDSAMPPW